MQKISRRKQTLIKWILLQKVIISIEKISQGLKILTRNQIFIILRLVKIHNITLLKIRYLDRYKIFTISAFIILNSNPFWITRWNKYLQNFFLWIVSLVCVTHLNNNPAAHNRIKNTTIQRTFGCAYLIRLSQKIK